MKKVFMLAVAALFLAIPAAQAQKVNKEALLAKVAKSDAEIADAKKGVKATTWINRGKLFYDIAAEPTKNLFVGVEATMLKLAMGDPASTEAVTVNGKEYEAWVYPWVRVYMKEGKVAAWEQQQFVMEDAPRMAIEAYAKAYELDPKTESKVREGLKAVSDFCAQVGDSGYELGNSALAADSYVMAFNAQNNPAFGTPDYSLLYYAGYLHTLDGQNNVASFARGVEDLTTALENGFADEEGNIYFYLFHCYYGQREAHPEYLAVARDMLLDGLKKYPKNSRILEGLMELYTSKDSVGDPAELVDLFDKSLAEQPGNVDLWFGRGRLFNALKNFDECIASFKKVVELRPDYFEGVYYLGLFYVFKGDEMNSEVNNKQYSSGADYEADLKKVNAVYMEALPWYEKAHEMHPTDPDVLQTLKSLCYRLRDEEGISAKYEKYNALYNQVKGE